MTVSVLFCILFTGRRRICGSKPIAIAITSQTCTRVPLHFRVIKCGHFRGSEEGAITILCSILTGKIDALMLGLSNRGSLSAT